MNVAKSQCILACESGVVTACAADGGRCCLWLGLGVWVVVNQAQPRARAKDHRKGDPRLPKEAIGARRGRSAVRCGDSAGDMSKWLDGVLWTVIE